MSTGILEILRERPMLADGAMGSLLYERGMEPETCCEMLNITDASAITAVHTAYLHAGAEIFETNTFGAHRFKLERLGLARHIREINLRGAELARNAAQGQAFVAGGMGPLGRLDEEAPDDACIAEIFQEQALLLVEGGVDMLILETFSSLPQLLIALQAIKKAVHVPVAAQMVFTPQGKTYAGHSATYCLTQLCAAGADIVGLNCGIGPKNALEILEGLSYQVPCPLSVLPNAGFPEVLGDRLLYSSSPEYFARQTAACAERGARILGGCCGTGPQHIAALHQALHQKHRSAPRIVISSSAKTAPPSSSSKPTPLAQKLEKGGVVMVELDPPKHLDTEPVLHAARMLAQAGVDAVTIAENPLAVPRLSNIVLAGMVREQAGCDVLVHLTGRDRNLVGIQSTIMGLAASGLHNVLAVTGDPPLGVDQVSGVYDVRSSELIALLQGFNEGRNHYGDSMRCPVRFAIGAAFNPNSRKIAMQVRRMEKKIACGARYFLTQPVYSRERVDAILEATQHIFVPIVLGIMPLASSRNAEFLHNEFPGIRIPDAIRQRMADCPQERQQQLGVDIAWELLEYAWPHFAGVYLIPPFNRYAMALALLERLPRSAFGRKQHGFTQ